MAASTSLLVHISVERLPVACVPLHMDPLGQAKHLLSFTYSVFAHTVAVVVVVVVVTVQLQSIHWSMAIRCAQRS